MLRTNELFTKKEIEILKEAYYILHGGLCEMEELEASEIEYMGVLELDNITYYLGLLLSDVE